MENMDGADETFGEWVAREQARCGYRSNRELAEAMVASRSNGGSVAGATSSVARWKSGEVGKLTRASVRSLAAALDVNPLEICIRTGLVTPEEAEIKELPDRVSPDPLVIDLTRLLRRLQSDDIPAERRATLRAALETMITQERSRSLTERLLHGD